MSAVTVILLIMSGPYQEKARSGGVNN
uniref:Uncharacterized protein n=1 Tax=Anguilla anguilla TaxID=7936 RepID=A0A0E9S7T8_ANGAN